MRFVSRWKLALIAVALIVAGVTLYPTVRLATLSAEEQQKMDPDALARLHAKALNLGLDLRGGMYILLEVDKSNLSKDEAADAVDRALEIIRNRIDQFGVSEPSIQREGTDRILVQLPGLQDIERAKRLIGQTALLDFKLVEEGLPAVLRDLDKLVPPDFTFQGVSASEEAAKPSPAAEPRRGQAAGAGAGHDPDGAREALGSGPGQGLGPRGRGTGAAAHRPVQLRDWRGGRAGGGLRGRRPPGGGHPGPSRGEGRHPGGKDARLGFEVPG